MGARHLHHDPPARPVLRICGDTPARCTDGAPACSRPSHSTATCSQTPVLHLVTCPTDGGVSCEDGPLPESEPEGGDEATEPPPAPRPAGTGPDGEPNWSTVWTPPLRYLRPRSAEADEATHEYQLAVRAALEAGGRRGWAPSRPEVSELRDHVLARLLLHPAVENPVGFAYKVARNKATDIVRKRTSRDVLGDGPSLERVGTAAAYWLLARHQEDALVDLIDRVRGRWDDDELWDAVDVFARFKFRQLAGKYRWRGTPGTRAPTLVVPMTQANRYPKGARWAVYAWLKENAPPAALSPDMMAATGLVGGFRPNISTSRTTTPDEVFRAESKAFAAFDRRRR